MRDLDAATIFQRAIDHDPQLLPSEMVFLFIHLSGKHPADIEKLDRLLSDELRASVDAEVASAPKDPDGWRNLQLLTPGRDCDAIKSCLRYGVEAIRDYRHFSS